VNPYRGDSCCLQGKTEPSAALEIAASPVRVRVSPSARPSRFTRFG
jgi:hypothetical protein